MSMNKFTGKESDKVTRYVKGEGWKKVPADTPTVAEKTEHGDIVQVVDYDANARTGFGTTLEQEKEILERGEKMDGHPINIAKEGCVCELEEPKSWEDMEEDKPGTFEDEGTVFKGINENSLIGDIKSSGERRVFETGAHRDSNEKVLKGRWDLIPAVALHRFAAFCSTMPAYTLQELEAQHSLWYWNHATESMYLWLEGERQFMDRGPGQSNPDKFPWRYDHLSNALWMTMQLMQIGEDLPIWRPTLNDEHYSWMGNQPRYDMISPEFMRRVAIHYQKGGINYGDRNWEKGMPVMVTWDCAARHLSNWLENKVGDKEDHLAAVGWNICSTMHTIEMVNRGILPETLWDVPEVYHNIKVGIPAERLLFHQFFSRPVDDDDDFLEKFEDV